MNLWQIKLKDLVDEKVEVSFCKREEDLTKVEAERGKEEKKRRGEKRRSRRE